MTRLPATRAPVAPADPNRAMDARLDRAAALLAAWEPETASADNAGAVLEAARAAVASGEAQALLDALGAPLPVLDLGRLVAELVASWPPRAAADLAIYSQNMAGDVARAAPSRAAMLLACRNLRAQHTFPPSIAEVLAAVEEAKRAVHARRQLLARLPRRIAELEAKDEQP